MFILWKKTFNNTSYKFKQKRIFLKSQTIEKNPEIISVSFHFIVRKKVIVLLHTLLSCERLNFIDILT
jgi:hypothetical protein